MSRRVPEWFPRCRAPLPLQSYKGSKDSDSSAHKQDQTQECEDPISAMVWEEPGASSTVPALPLDVLVALASETTSWPGFCLVCKAWSQVTSERRFWTFKWNSRWNVVPLFDHDPDLGSATFWAGAYKQMHLAFARCIHAALGSPTPVDIGPGRIPLLWSGYEAHVANFAIFSGSWVYETGVPRDRGLGQIGWIVPDHRSGISTDGVGDKDGGWAFDGERKYFWHGARGHNGTDSWAETRKYMFGRSWRNATTLGIGIQVHLHGKVAFEFFLDGQSIGVAPSQLSPSVDRAPFFPAVSWQTQRLYIRDYVLSAESQKTNCNHVSPGPYLRFDYGVYKPLLSEQYKRFIEQMPSFPEAVVVLHDSDANRLGIIPKR